MEHMSASMNYQQPVRSRSEAEMELVQLVLLLPAMLVAIDWVCRLIASAMGLPGADVTTDLTSDEFGLLISTIVYAVAILAVPATVRALRDPERAKLETKLAMQAVAAWEFGLLQRVAQPLRWLEHRTPVQTVLTTRLGNRSAIRPQTSIPASGFAPGDSPQLE